MCEKCRFNNQAETAVLIFAKFVSKSMVSDSIDYPKQGCSASNTGLIVAKEMFRWLNGEEKIISYVKPTGFRSDFCSRCGSVVPNPFRDKPYVWVPAGSLDDSSPLEIAAHICVASKASWDNQIPSELIDLVHDNADT